MPSTIGWIFLWLSISSPLYTVDEPDHLPLDLPLTRLIGMPLELGTEHPKHFHFLVPLGQPTFLPMAEVRLVRNFAQLPINLNVELKSDPSGRLRAGNDGGIHHTINNVEKLIFTGKEAGGHSIKIWGEMVGVPRPNFPKSQLEQGNIAIIYERLYGGIPITMLPILVTIISIGLLIHLVLVPVFIKFLLQTQSR